MRMHVEAEFTHDTNGRMMRVNEPGGGVAPRFFLGRTTQGSALRFRYDLDDALVAALELTRSRERQGEEYLVAPYNSIEYEEILARAAPVQRKWTGPAYRFP